MDSVRRLSLFFAFVLCFFCSHEACAVNRFIVGSEGDVYAACASQGAADAKAYYAPGTATSCWSVPGPYTIGGTSACPGGAFVHLYDAGRTSPKDGAIGYSLCVTPGQCNAGQTRGGIGFDLALSSAPVSDGGGCCISYVENEKVKFGTMGWSSGYGVTNGSYCAQPRGDGIDPGSAPDKDKKLCNGASCYDPKNKKACYTTEYGEQRCIGVGDGDPPGGCISGATGAVCYSKDGNDPPKPSDPPIEPNKPPDNSKQIEITKDGKTTVINVNNYSGTSDGGGPSGGSGGDSSDPQSGGSSHNQNGNGNGPGPNGGKGTDPNGKCADGSVPTASGCSGSYVDNGCDTPPACFGDAVMCGANRELHAIKCNTRPASGSSSGGKYGLPDGVPGDGGESGDPQPSGLVTEIPVGESGFDSSGLGYSRSCPADPTFVAFGKTYTIPIGPVCDWASMFGWFVLLLAYLAAMRIVATGRS